MHVLNGGLRMKYKVVIGLDPGLTGGLTILDGKKQPQIYEMPLESIVVNKTKKNIYDLDAISAILEPYRGKNVLFVQEKVTARKTNGVTSMFNFGFSAGSTLGIASAMGFDRYEARPQLWKKSFPELKTQAFNDLKAEAKKLRDLDKPVKAELKRLKELRKTIKDKDLKKTNKKEIDRLKKEVALVDAEVEKINAKAKTEAKKASRAVASQLQPDLAHRFKRVKDDGLAESMLIAIFGKEIQSELV